ncbi:hypothetical protein Tco_0888802 [Tanacetum coccineum]
MATQPFSTFVGVGSSNAPTIVAVLETTRNLEIWCNYELVKLSDRSLKAHCKHCDDEAYVASENFDYPHTGLHLFRMLRDAQKRIQHISSLEGDCLDVEEQLHDVEVEGGYTISLFDKEIQLDEAASEARSPEAEDE